jgi:excisionase family DNA binding protein
MTHQTHSEAAPVHSVEDFIKTSGLSRATVYKEINEGRLRTFKVGRRRLISEQARRDWIIQSEARTAHQEQCQ